MPLMIIKASKAASSTLGTVYPGDVLDIEAKFQNDAEKPIKDGKVVLYPGYIVAGTGYSETEGTVAKIAEIKSSQSVTVKGQYTVTDEDIPALTVKATYENGSYGVGGEYGPIDIAAKPELRPNLTSYAATKADANELMSAESGKKITDGVVDTFWIVVGNPLSKDGHYFVTCDVDGKCYGLNLDVKKDNVTIIYFSLASGEQIDFVDGTKKQDNATAKNELKGYKGKAVIRLWSTEAREGTEYPKAMNLLAEKTVAVDKTA